MTATDELRAMLDEREVKWTKRDGWSYWRTYWHTLDGRHVEGTQHYCSDVLHVGISRTTPAQAIEATLGRGTCRNIHPQKDTLDCFWCSECDAATGWSKTDRDGVLYPFKFCPSCGRQVTDE